MNIIQKHCSLEGNVFIKYISCKLTLSNDIVYGSTSLVNGEQKVDGKKSKLSYIIIIY